MKTVQSWLLGALKAIVVVGLCGMSLITVVDATGRYFFNSPLTGSVELIELLMILVIFSSIPLVSHGRSHIRVDIFHLFGSGRARQIQERATQLLSAGVSTLLAYATHLKAQSVMEYGDMTQMLSVSLAPFVYLMVVLLALDALLHLINAFAPTASLAMQADETEPTDADEHHNPIRTAR